MTFRSAIRSLLFIFFLGYAWIQGYSQQFHFQNYSVGEGLAQSQVYVVLEDSRGYIWMGTNGGGLSRFDGLQFKTYNRRDGLNNNFVRALHEDKKGQIWIGTLDGLSCFNGDRFLKFPLDSIRQVAVTAVLQDSSGLFWIGTSQGLLHFDGKQVVKPVKNAWKIDKMVNCLYQDSLGRIWVGTSEEAILIQGDHIERFNRKKGLPGIDVRSFSEDKNGHIWVATLGGGLGKYNGKKMERLTLPGGPTNIPIHSIYRDSRNWMWLGTFSEGLYAWNPADSLLSYFGQPMDLLSNQIRSISEDEWGNIWVGTSGGGATKCSYFPLLFEHFDEDNGLSGNFVYAISQDTANQLWIAASQKGYSILTDSTIVHYGRDSGFVNTKVRALFKDRDGRMWIGTDGYGLATRDTTGYFFIQAKDGLGTNWVRDITQDRLGNLWVAVGGSGISRLTIPDSLNGDWIIRRFNSRNGLPDNQVNALYIDKWDRVWCATNNKGLACLKNGKLIHAIDRRMGLPSNTIRSLVEDNSGYLWVGTGSGLGRIGIYEDSLIVEEVTPEELQSANIYIAFFEEEDKLWLGSNSGVDELILDEQRNIIHLNHFGLLEGFEGIETCRNAVWKDPEGDLWFGTIGGLTRYNPKFEKTNQVPPNLHFTDVKLLYKSLKEDIEFGTWAESWGGLKPGLELPYNKNNLGFDFVGINLSNPQKVGYRWILEGLEEDWSPLSSTNTVLYANLSPGYYTFKVIAENEDGVPSRSPIALSFSILPPFWQTSWFRTTCIISGVFIILLIFRWRLNQVRRVAQRRQEKLEMDKKMLELEQKALQLQMNPHFIFNTLNSIQGLIAQQDQKTARFYLAKFSKLMRTIMENSRESWITLGTEIQTLTNYLSLEQFSRDQTFSFSIYLPEELDPDLLLLPPMVIQPFVENAIIHGVNQIPGEGLIELHFHPHKDHLQCIITDNGIGRVEARKMKSQVDHRRKSMGLQVTRERLDLLNAGSSSEKSLEIQDLILPDGKPGGTKILLRLPIEQFDG